MKNCSFQRKTDSKLWLIWSLSALSTVAPTHYTPRPMVGSHAHLEAACAQLAEATVGKRNAILQVSGVCALIADFLYHKVEVRGRWVFLLYFLPCYNVIPFQMERLPGDIKVWHLFFPSFHPHFIFLFSPLGRQALTNKGYSKTTASMGKIRKCACPGKGSAKT